MIIKYWGVALTVAAFISLNAEANTSSLFHQLLKSVQNGHSIKDEQIASDGGDGDSASNPYGLGVADPRDFYLQTIHLQIKQNCVACHRAGGTAEQVGHDSFYATPPMRVTRPSLDFSGWTVSTQAGCWVR